MDADRRGNVEVRLDNERLLDELLIRDSATGHLVFHMERLDRHRFWMRAYGAVEDVIVHISSTEGNALPTYEWDERTEQR